VVHLFLVVTQILVWLWEAVHLEQALPFTEVVAEALVVQAEVVHKLEAMALMEYAL